MELRHLGTAHRVRTVSVLQLLSSPSMVVPVPDGFICRALAESILKTQQGYLVSSDSTEHTLPG